MAVPKTNIDLDMVTRNLGKKLIEGFDEYGGKYSPKDAFDRWAKRAGAQDIEEYIKNAKTLLKTEKDRVEAYKLLETRLKSVGKLDKARSRIITKELSVEYDILSAVEKRNDVYSKIVKNMKVGKVLLDKAVKSNKEIFEISHKMQLESNVTWANYKKLYNEAYRTTRLMNSEIDKSVHNIKDLINTQEKMLGSGWRDMKPTDLNNVSASVMNLAKTLGTMDENLITAFQQSYRIFGEKTDTFITSLGNSLNAFSDTFGISMGMLQGSVAEMIDSNNFISRSNMQSQIAANENLIRAAALTASVGLTTTDFITNLAKTSQWGTMGEMASLYEGGALLEGFDVGSFQKQMVGQDYAGATKDLFSSISATLNNIDDHYLRAEYMDRIGSTFGLSDDELLRISTHGGNLEAYDDNLTDKLLDVNNSMQDELADLHMTIVDRFDNWWENSWGSQKLGGVMSELGLYGLGDPIKSIATASWILVAQNAGLTKALGGLLPSGGLGQPAGVSTMTGITGANAAKLGGAAVGLGGLAASNAYFGGKLEDPNLSNSQVTGSATMNVLGSAASGALTGAMIGSMAGGPGVGTAIGAAVGAGIGLFTNYQSKEKRESAIDQMESDRRDAARAASAATYTGDPIVDAINRQTEILKSTLDTNYEENRRSILIYDTMKATSAAID